MSIYSCNYEVWATLQANSEGFVEYEVLYNGAVVYSGRVYSQAATVQVDISHVCREYLETFYENISYNTSNTANLYAVPSINGLTTIANFQVRSQDSDLQNFRVMYNYNSEYISEYRDFGNLNKYISRDVDRNQLITLSGYGSNQRYYYRINGNDYGSLSSSASVYQLYTLDLRKLSLNTGDKVTLVQGEVATVLYTFNVVEDCHNRFVLYYVNELGGLDFLLVNGRVTEGFNAVNTDIRLFNNRTSRTDWEQKRIFAEIDRTYTLNTRYLEDEYADRIHNLIYSPKVWLYDHNNETYTSVVVTNTNYTVKNFRNDRMFTYQINVKESQKLIRR